MNLTQAAQYTKRIIVFSIIFLILIIIAFIGYRVWKSWYIANQPKPEIRPEQKYGALPPIKFPTSKANPTSFTYSIDTTTGNLPTFDKMIKVYFIPKPVLTLLAPDRAKAIASKLGIEATPTILSEIKYKFNEDNKSLAIDIDSSNFKYINPASPSGQIVITENDNTLATGFRTFLSSLNLLKPNLEQGPFKIQYFKYGTPLIPVSSSKNAEVARISIWPGKIDEKPILTSDPNISPINGIVLESSRQLINYLEINYNYWPVDVAESSDYYLKPTDQAFEELKQGNGIIIQPPVTNQVSITNVTLAYFMPDTYSEYLQPIYVFSGPSFIAYIPAAFYEPAPAASLAPQ